MGVDKPSQNPLVQRLQLLTMGWGYNFYNEKNRARADDLLVREKAAHFLGEAISALSPLESAYRLEFVPPATRDNPFPPTETVQRLKAITRMTEQIRDRATLIRGASVPTQDKIWFHIRDERTLLYQLLAHDENLIQITHRIAETARALTPSGWDADSRTSAGMLAALLAELDTILRERAALLTLPTL